MSSQFIATRKMNYFILAQNPQVDAFLKRDAYCICCLPRSGRRLKRGTSILDRRVLRNSSWTSLSYPLSNKSYSDFIFLGCYSCLFWRETLKSCQVWQIWIKAREPYFYQYAGRWYSQIDFWIISQSCHSSTSSAAVDGNRGAGGGGGVKLL